MMEKLKRINVPDLERVMKFLDDKTFDDDVMGEDYVWADRIETGILFISRTIGHNVNVKNSNDKEKIIVQLVEDENVNGNFLEVFRRRFIFRNGNICHRYIISDTLSKKVLRYSSYKDYDFKAFVDYYFRMNCDTDKLFDYKEIRQDSIGVGICSAYDQQWTVFNKERYGVKLGKCCANCTHGKESIKNMMICRKRNKTFVYMNECCEHFEFNMDKAIFRETLEE